MLLWSDRSYTRFVHPAKARWIAANIAKLIEGRVIDTMIDNQIDEVMIFRDEVSGEVVEAAGLVALGGFPTLPRAGRGPNRPERKRIMLV